MRRYLLYFFIIIISFDIGINIYYKCGGSFSEVIDHFETAERKQAEVERTEYIIKEKQKQLAARYTICIDPGHGVTDKSGSEPTYPGSRGKENTYTLGMVGRKITEQALNLKYALALKDSLLEEGFNVIMTREQEECDLSISEWAKIGESADFIISLHCDGTSTGSPNGISFFYPEKNYFENTAAAEQSKEIGQYVFNSVITNTGAIRRGVSSDNANILFNWSKVPVFKIVFGSIENADDEVRIMNKTYMSRFISGATEGILRYVSHANPINQ